MSVLDKNIKEISGPLNVVRMEGTINGVKKVVYLFMDLHVSITAQTECSNVFSKDVQNFFADTFDKLNESDKIYDFFLEIRPREIENVNYGLDYPSLVNVRDIYLVQIWKLFRKMFVYESKKNKISLSKYFTNVRLHYIDTRDYIGNVIWYKLMKLIDIAADMWEKKFISVDQMDYMIETLQEANNYLRMMNEIIDQVMSPTRKPSKKFSVIKFIHQNNKPKNEINQQKEEFENIYYLVDKTFNMYKHKNIQQEMGKQLNDIRKEMDHLIRYSNSLIARYKKIADTTYHSQGRLTRDDRAHDKYQYGLSRIANYEFLMEVNISINEFYYVFMDTFAKFMDVYFLRRFLDKDYVTNAIAYTGAYHSLIYIKILARDFGFKITHVAYSKIKNLSELNKEVTKLSTSDMFGIFFPPIFSQCSNITHFPENFQ